MAGKILTCTWGIEEEKEALPGVGVAALLTAHHRRRLYRASAGAVSQLHTKPTLPRAEQFGVSWEGVLKGVLHRAPATGYSMSENRKCI